MTHAVLKLNGLARRFWRQAVCLTLAACLWAGAADLAWAQRKGKKEPEAAPTKSYTIPYMIVLAMLGVGLMTVCRPSSRLDKPPEKLSDDEKE